MARQAEGGRGLTELLLAVYGLVKASSSSERRQTDCDRRFYFYVLPRWRSEECSHEGSLWQATEAAFSDLTIPLSGKQCVFYFAYLPDTRFWTIPFLPEFRAGELLLLPSPPHGSDVT